MEKVSKGDDLEAIKKRDETKRQWAKGKGISYIEIGDWEYKTEKNLVDLLDGAIRKYVAGFNPPVRN
jgi:hypothetical protein